MKNLNPERLIIGSDLINRIKPEVVYLKDINDSLNLVMLKEDDIITFNLGYYTGEDISYVLRIENTVTFNRMVRYFRGEDCNLEIKEESLNIYNDKRNLTIEIGRFDIEPSFKKGKLITTNNIDGNKFKEIIDGLSTIKSKDGTRPPIKGIALTDKGYMALDGYTLSIYKEDLNIVDEFVISGNTVDYLKKLLVNHKDIYTIKELDNQIIIEQGDITIYSNNKSKEVFNYKSILRESNKLDIEVDSKKLIEDIDYLKNISEVLKCKFDDNIMILETVDKGSKASIKSKFNKVDGTLVDDYTIGINPDHLIRVLKLYDTEDLRVGFNNTIEPVFIEDDNILSLVMPIHLRRYEDEL